MELILKKDVVNLGRFSDVVKVADGYGRNYLIPQGLAVPANPANMKQLEAEKEAYLKKAKVIREKADADAAALNEVSLSFKRKSGDDGRLFGSVTSHDIEEALKAKGITVLKRDIHITHPIKALGESTVEIKLHHDVSATIKVTVDKE